MRRTSIAYECSKTHVSKKTLRNARLNIKIHQMTEQEAHAFWERRNARQEEATRKHNERRKESDKQMVELQELYDSIKSPLLKKKVDELLFCFNDCFIKWTYNHRKRLSALLYVVKSELQKEQDALKQMEKILG
tara:strand:+ start:1062 stop:1463 length:402 start_codon:yes stop_codon:yes gene_type:complete